LGRLESHVIQQGRFGEIAFGNGRGVMNTLPPADKVQQFVSIEAQSVVRQPANIFTVQEAIDPIDAAARGLFDDAKRTLSVAEVAIANHMELHG
jgi:hypothetical protein